MIWKHQDTALRLELHEKIIFEISSDKIPDDFYIGRSSDCFWQIPETDKSAGNKHVRIYKKGKNLFIQDMKSRNGTYFMGKRITERRLSNGDIYGIGDCKLIVETVRRDDKNSRQELYHRLEQISGNSKGKVYSLEKNYNKIGSADGCDIQIPDAIVSHLHATLENHDDGTCWIKDNGSRNGTKVNGTPLSAETAKTGRMLKDGDIVSITYVDFRFLDKAVVHVRSHIAIKIAVVVATLAIVLGGYFGVKTAFPSAREIRLQAENHAAMGDFQTARKLLSAAADARGAENDAQQRGDLILKLGLWENTHTNWEKIKAILAEQAPGDWRDANSLFATLISPNNENWKWNATNAIMEMKNAQETHNLLTILMTVEERLQNSEENMEYMLSLTHKLEQSKNTCAKTSLDYRKKLLQRTDDILAEMKQLAVDYKTMQNVIGGYDHIDKTNEIILALNNIKQAADSRIAAGQEKNLPVSKAVSNYCENLIEPMLLLQKSKSRLDENYIAVVSMKFSSFVDKLPLPGTEQCMVAANLSTRRAEMEKNNQQLAQTIIQLKNFQYYFEHNLVAPGQESPLLKQLFDSAVLDAVLACDCLEQAQPLYSVKKPVSHYDRLLGIHVWFEYLRSLDGDFDTTLFDERFKPNIFRDKEIFDNLEIFVAFCKPAEKSPFHDVVNKLLSLQTENNQFDAYRRAAGELLDKRDAFLRKTYQIYMDGPNTRRGIIAGGIAICLKTKSSKIVPDNTAADLIRALQTLRRKLSAIAEKNQNSTPEKLLEAEQEILELGIPGDPLLKQPWADKFNRRK